MSGLGGEDTKGFEAGLMTGLGAVVMTGNLGEGTGWQDIGAKDIGAGAQKTGGWLRGRVGTGAGAGDGTGSNGLLCS